MKYVINEQQHIQELLKPRYMVIADYPHNSQHSIGDILIHSHGDYFKRQDGKKGMVQNPENFPANFKRLEWWEERDKKDMPDYLKREGDEYDDGHTGFFMNNEEMPTILKVKAHFRTNLHDWLRGGSLSQFVSNWNNVDCHYGAYIPITKLQYELQNALNLIN